MVVSDLREITTPQAGLQDEEDSWESLSAMASEVPVKVNEYVGGRGSAELKIALAQRRGSGNA
ncbi:hypothetical protein JG687_00014751 [Phytophthora cactorum]|uniref:Uncharacterized protein n=1 Tax=Phytophthora cactorum TaxID=29920 RepID=A0A8T1TVN8_9STRA|nr:hypothetical protein PC120_g3132 [Phytophthora cactorum]KAG3046909.1 hypothetical protein PC121_g20387 [Phytophthora cactorum]KAG3183498.1 hypothetical protein PC128_g14171 [Phytophthora cactorum]KAG4061235.1 hypothetical protein PC123_g3880 [Phytophthora cactorum]KAG6949603.1 hypothetical protein JG687_00014751 [Phytophthora cactorum]